MPNLLLLQWAASLVGTIFAFMFGAVAGSFINVLVYRLPLGLNVITPPSACPRCETKLTWRENLPIVGWLLLRGRCRFCREPISPEYPIVETIVALLFAVLYALWFFNDQALASVGLDLSAWRPPWPILGGRAMLPALVAVLLLVGTLVAITIIDARTFMIPLALPWFATIVGLLLHPIHAWWVYGSKRNLEWAFPDWEWVIPPIPSDQPGLLAGCLAGAVGLGVSLLLIRLGVLRRSFADYESWEAEHAAASKREPTGGDENSPEDPAEAGDDIDLKPILMGVFLLTGPAVALLGLGYAYALSAQLNPLPYTLGGLVMGLLVGVLLRRIVSRDDADGGEPIWVQYPFARREMGIELLFLLPCLLLGGLAWFLAEQPGGLREVLVEAPIALRVLGGSLLGYFVGGGVIWGVRIFGTLAFGKEAMGLGDVHLLGAVGAVLGWINPLLAFFSALFLGIGWAMLSVFSSRLFKREGTALPFGPHLAAAALLTLYLRPLYEWAMTQLFNTPLTLP